jgi:hypothetical protein
MVRIQYFLLLACTLIFASGCQTSGGQSNNWLSGQTTVQPPQAYSLNIPSMASNSQPNTAKGSPALVNPNQRAPVSANQMPGTWTRQGMVTPNVGQPANGVAVANSGFVETTGVVTNPGFVNGGPAKLSVPVLQSTYTKAADYASTQIDESRDDSRLPLNDASAVMAPSGFGGTPRVATLPAGLNNQFAGKLTVPNSVGTSAPNQNFMVNPVLPPANQQGLLATPAAVQGGAPPQGWSMRSNSSDSAGKF